MFQLPTDALVHEIFPHLSTKDLRCLDVAVSNRHMRRQLMYMYPNMRHVKHSTRGLDEHEMAWFFERGIPLTSVSLATTCSALAVTAIFHMLLHSGRGLAERVRHLNLHPCRQVLKATHGEQVLALCSNQLESLDLTKCRSLIDDEFIVQLASRSTGLTTLLFTDNCHRHLQTPSYRALGRGCVSLTSIDLSDSYGITEAAIIALTDTDTDTDGPRGCCSGLTAVSLAGTHVGASVIVALAQRCQLLTSLDISNCANSVNEAAVTALAQGCPRLTTLKLINCWRQHVTAERVTELARGCRLLAHLDLGSCGVTDACVLALARECRSLVYLSLTWCRLISDVAVSALIRYDCPPTLSTLCLGYTRVTDVSVLAIANGGLAKLRRLDITKDEDDDDAEEEGEGAEGSVSDQARAQLARLRPHICQVDVFF